MCVLTDERCRFLSSSLLRLGLKLSNHFSLLDTLETMNGLVALDGGELVVIENWNGNVVARRVFSKNGELRGIRAGSSGRDFVIGTSFPHQTILLLQNSISLEKIEVRRELGQDMDVLDVRAVAQRQVSDQTTVVNHTTLLKDPVRVPQVDKSILVPSHACGPVKGRSNQPGNSVSFSDFVSRGLSGRFFYEKHRVEVSDRRELFKRLAVSHATNLSKHIIESFLLLVDEVHQDLNITSTCS